MDGGWWSSHWIPLTQYVEEQNEGIEMSVGHEGLEKIGVAMAFWNFIELKRNKSANQQREPMSA